MYNTLYRIVTIIWRFLMKKNFVFLSLLTIFLGGLLTSCDIFDIKITIKTGNIEVVNDTGFYLKTITYRKQGDTSYGSNQILSSSYTLSPGSKLDIVLLDTGKYEVQATAYGDDNFKFYKGNITVESDNKTTTVNLTFEDINLNDTNKGIIKFVNNTGNTITYLYKRNVGGEFGDDMLGFATTLSNNNYFYTFVDPGTYDFRASTRTTSSGSGIDYVSKISSYTSGVVIEKSKVKIWTITVSDKL